MTIEFSLRKRAAQSRWFAVVYLSFAVIVLIGSYISLPTIASGTLQSLNEIESSAAGILTGGKDSGSGNATFVHLHLFAIIILILCLSVVSFASYLLARSAFIELEMAARFIGLADAILIAGNDFEKLEKAAILLVPRGKYFPEVTEKHFKTFLETLKSVRG